MGVALDGPMAFNRLDSLFSASHFEMLLHQCSVMVDEKHSKVEKDFRGQQIIDLFLKTDKRNFSRLMQVPA